MTKRTPPDAGGGDAARPASDSSLNVATPGERPALSPAPDGDLYRLLVTAVRDYGIFMLDPGGHIASWNEGAQRIKGYTAAEILGRHFSTFYPPEAVADGFPDYELRVAASDGRFEDEGWRVRKDGSRFWANVVITALRDDAGTLVGFAKVTRDLSERREAEARRLADARRVASAEAANSAKNEFLATMSHELRTPLNAIGGYVELLLEGVYGAMPESQQEVLARIRRSQQHLLTIIADLLNYSRIESGQVQYDIQSHPIAHLLDAVTAMTDPQAQRKGIGLQRKECPEDLIALCDRARTEQILLNLLSNAIKFTPAGGSIVVWCAQTGDAITVSVRDTGPGVPPERLEEIFQPFVQVGRGLSNPHEGVGLGLAISRDLARAMGGDLNAANAHDGGAEFTLRLPAS